MKATRAASMASPLLLLAAFSTRAFAQTPEPGTAPADTRNPGGIVVPSTTVLVGEPVVFTECECSISASVFTYTWPPVEISPGPVGARVTVKLDQAGNPVSTITASVDGLATDVYQNLEDIWNYALRTTGVSISDGSIPVITVTRTIYTEADEFFTTLQTIVYPTPVNDWGYLAFVTPTTTLQGTACTTSPPEETLGLSPLQDLYTLNVPSADWDSMLPEDLSTCDSSFNTVTNPPLATINVRSALTDTVTQYDDFQQSQNAPTAGSSEETTTSQQAVETPEAPEEPAPTQQAPVQSPPTQAAEPPTPTQQPPVESPPEQAVEQPPAPTQQPPVEAPPASASASAAVQTPIGTPAAPVGTTLTSGGPVATISPSTSSVEGSSSTGSGAVASFTGGAPGRSCGLNHAAQVAVPVMAAVACHVL